MGFLAWIIFGALAGWVAGIITGANKKRGCIGNIILGVLGAFLGGFLMKLITGASFSFTFDWGSFIVAVIGAILLLTITGATKKRK